MTTRPPTYRSNTLGRLVTVPENEPDPKPCRWFAMYDNPATGTLNAGPLGDVDICDRCRAIAERNRTTP